MRTPEERIAALETRATAAEARERQILEKLEKIDSELTRYRGFIGGITFLASGAVLFVSLFKDWLLGKFNG